jgi:hypothetical protein
VHEDVGEGVAHVVVLALVEVHEIGQVYVEVLEM